MSDFNKDDYLNDLPDADELANGQASPDADGADAPSDTGEQLKDDMLKDAAAEQSAGEQASEESAKAAAEATADAASDGDAEGSSLTPLGQAKKEAAEYLEALQRERAEFINYRNRTKKDMDRARQQGIIDVLTAMLPGLDDIDRIREHGEMDVDPTKHEAILHKPDPEASKATVDTVVEAGYRIGDRVIRAARVVVASPQN
ncbi:MAG: nucleotide exchange factor GrpE [Bifidobacterium animalis]|nr:nucleotide exchange factor GrpE [Bifidobacterium animalis]